MLQTVAFPYSLMNSKGIFEYANIIQTFTCERNKQIFLVYNVQNCGTEKGELC